VGSAQLAFQDIFANRQTTTSSSGRLTGNNSTATVEVGEPQIGGKPGDHSVWISWVAPTDGVATFDTHGSTFDTLLSAFFLGSTNDTTVDKLHEAARNDDDPNAPPTSLIQFGALAGHHYEIGVAGFHGAAGEVVLNWSFVSISAPPPVIVGTPNDQAARQGDPVTLTVLMQASSSVQLRWTLNGVELEEKTATLFIPSLQPSDLGRYTLRIKSGPVSFDTTPTEIQINSDGQTNALARDKILDSTASPLIGEDGSGGGRQAATPRLLRRPTFQAASAPIGVVRGYNGSQIFSTIYATTDPSEPMHCGVTGGSSYWLTYEPPSDGTMTLDTIGSAYDTVMEVYTYNVPPQSYADLIPIGCDNDSAGLHGPSRVRFAVIKTRPYVVVVDGVNGARGTAWLNYKLDTNQPPQAPTATVPLTTLVVTNGSSVLLEPPISGSPPLHYSWSKDGVIITNYSSTSMFLTGVTTAIGGDYTIVATNDLGTVTTIIRLKVTEPPQCSVAKTPAGIQLQFPSSEGILYSIEEAPAVSGPWQSWPNPLAGNGQPIAVTLTNAGTRFFRLRLE